MRAATITSGDIAVNETLPLFRAGGTFSGGEELIALSRAQVHPSVALATTEAGIAVHAVGMDSHVWTTRFFTDTRTTTAWNAIPDSPLVTLGVSSMMTINPSISHPLIGPSVLARTLDGPMVIFD